MLLLCAVFSTADVVGQPIMRTHVESGDVEGLPEGNLAVYKAILMFIISNIMFIVWSVAVAPPRLHTAKAAAGLFCTR